MYGCSNTLIGFVNLVSLVASVPLIGAGLWLSRTSTTCESFLHTPLLVLGLIILILSLAGFIGACFHVACALWVYLVSMLVLIVALMALTVFGFVVMSHGGGVEVSGRVYKEYQIDKYSPWLRKKIEDTRNWVRVRSCVVGSKACANIVVWTPSDYSTRDMTPIQSGCCKPPTSCNYAATAEAQEPDCYRWNNAESVLCYDCESCKAAVLENVRREWHKVSVMNIVIVLILIGIYTIGCCAFRNARRSNHFPYKMHPNWDPHWWRWWDDRRDRFY